MGTALGLQNAVNSLGKTGGPFLGGILLGWNIHAPYLLAALPLVAFGILVAKKVFTGSFLVTRTVMKKGGE